MKISEISNWDVAAYLRLEDIDIEPEVLDSAMAAAKDYIMNYTGLKEEELDNYDDMYIAFMALVQDIYDNRAMYFYGTTQYRSIMANKTVESILDMHVRNLI